MVLKRRMIVYAVLIAVFSVSASGSTLIRFKSSLTMKIFGDRLAEWYTQENPSVRFDLEAEQPANNFSAMAKGQTDIVQSSRQVLHSEAQVLREAQGKDYVELQVATEVAGIAVSKINPVRELSLYDLRQVFSGKVNNWKQVGGQDAPIRIYGRDDTSGVRQFLEEEFMGDQSMTSNISKFPTNARMWQAMAVDPNSIGFGTFEMDAQENVRFLGIKPSTSGQSVAPTDETIRSKRYKLTRPLYFYFAGVPTGDVERFAEWVLSPKGQLVVESQGYYPLTSSEREAGTRALSGK